MRIIKINKECWLIAFIIAVGIVYRFLPIGIYQFSHDELSGLSRTIFSSFSQEVEYGVKVTDTHPVLIQLFLWVWVNLFGNHEIAVKIPFLVCGILSVWYIYKFAKDFFNINTALVAATIVSTSFIFLIYSSYARMYVTGVLFSILFLSAVFKIIFSDEIKQQHYWQFLIFGLLCAYNHHMSCLFALSVAVLALFYIKKQELKKYMIFGLAIIVLYLPHLPITLYQFSIGGIGASAGGWLPPPRPNELYFFILTLLGCGISGIIHLILFAALIVVSIVKHIAISKKQLLLLWIFSINYLIIHLYSVFKNPILQNSVLLFSGICLIVFLSSFSSFLSKKAITVVCSLLIVFFSFQSFYKKDFTKKVHLHNFDMMTSSYLNLIHKQGMQSVSAVFAAENCFIINYELKHQQKFKYVLMSDTIFYSPLSTHNYFASLTSNYLVLGDVSPLTIQLAKEFFPNVYDYDQSYFYNFIVLSKTNTNYSFTNANPIIKTLSIKSIDSPFSIETPLKLVNNTYVLDSLCNEFPFALKAPFAHLNCKEGQWLLFDVTFLVDTINSSSDDLFCVSIKTSDETTDYFTAVKFSDFSTQRTLNHLYLQTFVGSNVCEWQKNGTLTAFIWKKNKSKLTLMDVKLQLVDYNPDKWKLWK